MPRLRRWSAANGWPGARLFACRSKGRRLRHSRLAYLLVWLHEFGVKLAANTSTKPEAIPCESDVREGLNYHRQRIALGSSLSFFIRIWAERTYRQIAWHGETCAWIFRAWGATRAVNPREQTLSSNSMMRGEC